jgi:hypothetical protein
MTWQHQPAPDRFAAGGAAQAETAMQTRRAWLAGGVATATLLLGGAGYRVWDRGVLSNGEGVAYAPWGDWQGQQGDDAKRPLRAAILAANPHDTQPWIFEVKQNTITLFADRRRNLGSFDPFRREMHLGLGAAVENLVLAARAFGFAATVAPVDGRLLLSPEDTIVPAVHIVLAPMPATRDALFEAIPQRHTNRGPYRADQAVGADRLRRFTNLITDDTVQVVFFEDLQARGDLGALIVEATQRIIGDPQMSADSAHWFRTGRRDVAAHRDGVTVDAAGVSPFTAAASKFLPDLDARSADQYWLSITSTTQVPTAAVLGMLLVRDRLDMRSAIQAGRAWQRLHLAVTAEGLAGQPLNQPIECLDRDAMLGRTDGFAPALTRFAGTPGWEATFVFRLGTPARPAAQSPRRSLEEVLRT